MKLSKQILFIAYLLFILGLFTTAQTDSIKIIDKRTTVYSLVNMDTNYIRDGTILFYQPVYRQYDSSSWVCRERWAYNSTMICKYKIIGRHKESMLFHSFTYKIGNNPKEVIRLAGYS